MNRLRIQFVSVLSVACLGLTLGCDRSAKQGPAPLMADQAIDEQTDARTLDVAVAAADVDFKDVLAKAAVTGNLKEFEIVTSNFKLKVSAAMDDNGVIHLETKSFNPKGFEVESVQTRIGRRGKTENTLRVEKNADAGSGTKLARNLYEYEDGVVTLTDHRLYYDNGNMKQWAHQEYEPNGIRKYWHYGRHARHRTALILREGEFYDREGWTSQHYTRTYYKNPFIDQIPGSMNVELIREGNFYEFAPGGRVTSHIRRGYDGAFTKLDLTIEDEGQNDFYERVTYFDWHGRCERYENEIREKGRDLNKDGVIKREMLGTVYFSFNKNQSRIPDELPSTCVGQCPNSGMPTLMPKVCRESNPPPECNNPTL